MNDFNSFGDEAVAGVQPLFFRVADRMRLEGYVAALVDDNMSLSLVSGHDARELYALNLPPARGEARWEATLGFLTGGQAFDVDRSQATSGQGFVLYSIERKTKEVVGARYPALAR